MNNLKIRNLIKESINLNLNLDNLDFNIIHSICKDKKFINLIYMAEFPDSTAISIPHIYTNNNNELFFNSNLTISKLIPLFKNIFKKKGLRLFPQENQNMNYIILLVQPIDFNLSEKKIIKEEEDIDWDLYDILNDSKFEVMQEFIDALEKEKPNINKNKFLKARQNWEVIPFSVLQRQWEEFIKWGYVKENYIKTIEEIEKLITKNITKINVNTELAGHTPYSPKYDWQDFLEGKIPEKKMNKFIDYLGYHFCDFIEEPHGQMRISDYGLEKLNKGLSELRKATTPEKKLAKIDYILSVIHQRSDIAAWFVEGGSQALSKLSSDI